MSHLFSPERWVVTGLSWAAIAFPLTLAVNWFQGEAVVADDLALQTGIWAVAGLAFGQTMRFVSRRNLTHAR